MFVIFCLFNFLLIFLNLLYTLHISKYTSTFIINQYVLTKKHNPVTERQILYHFIYLRNPNCETQRNREQNIVWRQEELGFAIQWIWDLPGSSGVKNLPAMLEMQEMQVWSLGGEGPLENEMATHSSILAWEIPWTEDPGGLRFMGSQKSPIWLSDSVQFSSVTLLCPTLCDPVDCRMPGLPLHHQLPESTQTHVHWISDAISSSIFPFSSCPQSFPASGFFQMSQLFISGGQSIGVSASTSVLPMNIHDWFPLEWLVGTPCSPRDSQEFSPTPQFKSINSSALSFLYSPTLTSIHDYWKNHSFDYMDLCWQSNVSAF